jgi:hypothetical protein
MEKMKAAIWELQASQQMVMAGIKATRAGQENMEANQENVRHPG